MVARLASPTRRRGELAARPRFTSLVPTQLHRLLDDPDGGGGAAHAAHGPARRRPDRPGAARAARTGPGCGWWRRTASAETCGRLRVRRRAAGRRRRSRWPTTAGSGSPGRCCSTGTTATRRSPRRRWSTAGSCTSDAGRLDDDGRLRGARPGRRRGRQRRRQRARCRRSPPGCATHPGRRRGRGARRRRTPSGASGWWPSWSGDLTLDEARDWVADDAARAPGRRASSWCVDALPLLANGKVDRVALPELAWASCDEGLLDPDADPLPRASPSARGCCCAATAGLGGVEPVPGVPARGRRAVAALRRGGRRRVTGRRRCATGCRSTSPCPAVGPEQAHDDRAAPAGCATAKVKVAEPGQTLADDQARLEAVRDALGPGGRVRVDANGAWDVDTAVAAIARAGPGGRRAGVRRAAVRRASRSSPRYAGPVDVPIAADESIRRAADPYRVRDLEAADVAVLKVQPLGGVPGLPADRRGDRAARRGVLGAGDLGRDRRRGRAGGGAARAAVRLRAGHRAAARPTTWSPTRCCRSTGCCRSAGPSVDAAALRPARGARPTGSRTGRPGWPRCGRCGRIGARDQPLDRAGPRRWSPALVEAGVREVVLSPGSRNAPLAFAAYDAAEAGPAPAAHPDRRADRPASSRSA